MNKITSARLLPFLAKLLIFLVFAGSVPAAFAGTEDDRYRVKTIVIDPGHGGHDAGCSGKHSHEKHIALALALKVGSYIEENLPDVKVHYTRTTDVFVPLHRRAEIANQKNADVFISIHCNSISGKPDVHGTETFVMGLHKTEQNLSVAKRENAVITMEDDYQRHYDGFDPNAPESHIIFSLYQNAHLDQSISLASKIENQFTERARRKSRGVKQAGFLVLYRTTMPAVLIETGFLTNSAEENYLSTDPGQSFIASAIYRAFKDYKEEIEMRVAPNTPGLAQVKIESNSEPVASKTNKTSATRTTTVNENPQQDPNKKGGKTQQAQQQQETPSPTRSVELQEKNSINLITNPAGAEGDVHGTGAAESPKIPINQPAEPTPAPAPVVAEPTPAPAPARVKPADATPSKPAQPSTRTTVEGVEFRVQIYAGQAPSSLPQQHPVKKFVSDARTEVNNDGYTRYMLGSYNSFDDAVNYQNQMRNQGFHDAFVVAYKNGIRVPVNSVK